MKVSALIDVLKKCSPDDDVFVVYDSVACVVAIEPDQIVKATNATFGNDDGVWLCAMSGDDITWHIEQGEDGHLERIAA